MKNNPCGNLTDAPVISDVPAAMGDESRDDTTAPVRFVRGKFPLSHGPSPARTRTPRAPTPRRGRGGTGLVGRGRLRSPVVHRGIVADWHYDGEVTKDFRSKTKFLLDVIDKLAKE